MNFLKEYREEYKELNLNFSGKYRKHENLNWKIGSLKKYIWNKFVPLGKKSRELFFESLTVQMYYISY